MSCKFLLVFFLFTTFATVDVGDDGGKSVRM